MKFIITLLIAFFITTTFVQAAKVDIYKTAIQNKIFTIKYKMNEFPIRGIDKNANKNIKNINGISLSATISSRAGQGVVNSGGIIVVNKDDTYFERFFDDFTLNFISKSNSLGTSHKSSHKFKASGNAMLFKNGEMFSFLFEMKNDGTKNYFTYNMWGGKSSKVSKDKSEKLTKLYEKYGNPYQKLFQDYNFGNLDLHQALVPILPPSQIILTPNTPNYKFVGSGTLENGLTYEDFYGEKNNNHCAIRYYFNGDKMIKIATFNYIKDGRDVKFYEKRIIDIEEFLTTADKKYLELPASLQDVTKRNKEGDK